jgi:hypothetical protein
MPINQKQAEKLLEPRLKAYSEEHGGEYVVRVREEKPNCWVFHSAAVDRREEAAQTALTYCVSKDCGDVVLVVGFPERITAMDEEMGWDARYKHAQSLANEGRAEAVQALQYSLETSKKMAVANAFNQGRMYARTMDCLQALGEYYLKSGDSDQSERAYIELKELMDSMHPLPHNPLAAQRVPMLERLIELKTNKKSVRETDELIRELAQTHLAAKDPETARATLEQHLQKQSQLYSQGHPAIAQTLASIASINNDLKQYDEADEYYGKAVAAWQWLFESPERLAQVTGDASDATRKQVADAASKAMYQWASSLRRRDKNDKAKALSDQAAQLLRG